jgi:hypothetical protein
MKVKFSRSVTYVPAFGGNQELPETEQFTAELSVLDMGDMLNVMDALEASRVGTQVDTERLTMSQSRPFLELAPEILPKYVTLNNFTDESGAAIPIDEVVGKAFFIGLQIELLMQLSAISSPGEDASKNSKAPLDS